MQWCDLLEGEGYEAERSAAISSKRAAFLLKRCPVSPPSSPGSASKTGLAVGRSPTGQSTRAKGVYAGLSEQERKQKEAEMHEWRMEQFKKRDAEVKAARQAAEEKKAKEEKQKEEAKRQKLEAKKVKEAEKKVKEAEKKAKEKTKLLEKEAKELQKLASSKTKKTTAYACFAKNKKAELAIASPTMSAEDVTVMCRTLFDTMDKSLKKRWEDEAKAFNKKAREDVAAAKKKLKTQLKTKAKKEQEEAEAAEAASAQVRSCGRSPARLGSGELALCLTARGLWRCRRNGSSATTARNGASFRLRSPKCWCVGSQLRRINLYTLSH